MDLVTDAVSNTFHQTAAQPPLSLSLARGGRICGAARSRRATRWTHTAAATTTLCGADLGESTAKHSIASEKKTRGEKERKQTSKESSVVYT